MPESRPEVLSVTPFGRAPVLVQWCMGTPVAVIWKLLVTVWLKVALSAEVIVVDGSTVRSNG